MPDTTTVTRPTRPTPPVPPPLLTMVTEQAVDQDYREVARRRAARGETAPRSRLSGHTGVVVAIAIFGLLVTVAALQTSRTASTSAADKARLVTQVNAKRATVADLLNRSARLRAGNASLMTRQSEITDADLRAQASLRRLQIATGLIAVHGPGLRITVTDAPDARAEPAGLVRDRDLGLLVNGLWEAGAEAISVDGQRLTSADAIRNVGIVPQVDGVPLRSPYVVLAIGNERTLESDLFDTTTGLQFKSTTDYVGIGVTTAQVDDVSVPAASRDQLVLHYATSDSDSGKPPSDGGEGP